MSEGQNVKKLRITSSIIVTDILIKPQQFLTCTLVLSCMLPVFCCRDLDLGPMTSKLNRDLDILKTYLHPENEVAR